VFTISGFALAMSALLTGGLAGAGVLRRDAAGALVALGAIGSLLLLGGLVYALARQLRRRRLLPVRRYRGPSIVLQLALAIVLATLATLPFMTDAAALVLGEGELTLTGAAVLLTSTQAALVVVSWLFVLRPRAIAFALPLLGSLRVRALGAGFGWGVLAWAVASAVTYAMVTLFERLGLPAEPQPAEQAIANLEPWLVIVAIVIIAPIAEELFFRGVAFNAWLAERGRRFAYIGSAALFAAIHTSLISLLPIFLLGLALAWVYRRSGSLVAPIAMHATVNGISVALALLVRYEVVRLPV
jgi:membrane protease YdiL (CAAX protease family)